jgi:hypothetical protein
VIVTILQTAGLAVFAPGWALATQGWRGKIERFWSDAALVAGDVLFIVANTVARDWIFVAVFAVLGVISAWLCRFHWRRRKRRGRLAAIGAKSRARIAAMTARMRERPPRPALRPVPGGAR